MSEMPIRRVLQEELNQATNEQELDPFEAYTFLTERLKKRGVHYDDYAQATLTSGGHARNPELSWEEKLNKNIRFAQSMAEALFENGQLHADSTIEAATLGLINHWREKDYITFWFNVLARPNTTANGRQKTDRLRRAFDDHVYRDEIDFTKFNDYSLTNEERSTHYIAYAKAAVDAMKEFGDYRVIKRLVAVSEIAGSLGANTERFFTKRLGGTAYNLANAQFGGQQISDSRLPVWLIKDNDTLVRYGANVFDPHAGEQIIVVKARDDTDDPA